MKYMDDRTNPNDPSAANGIPIEQTPDILPDANVNPPNSAGGQTRDLPTPAGGFDPMELEQKLDREKDLPDPSHAPEFPGKTNIFPSNPPNGVKNDGRHLGAIAPIVGVVLLFGVGIGISMFVNYLNNSRISTVNKSGPESGREIIPPITPAAPVNQYEAWKDFEIANPTDKSVLAAIKIPPEMLPPICDGRTCASQGTFMPGGTRFTVSVRQGIMNEAEFATLTMTDMSGQPFETKSASEGAVRQKTYTGSFIGTTASGYKFTQMYGRVYWIGPGQVLEINHFSPSGINVDMAGDRQLFTKITNSLEIKTKPFQNPAVPTAQPSQAPATNSSGML